MLRLLLGRSGCTATSALLSTQLRQRSFSSAAAAAKVLSAELAESPSSLFLGPTVEDIIVQSDWEVSNGEEFTDQTVRSFSEMQTYVEGLQKVDVSSLIGSDLDDLYPSIKNFLTVDQAVMQSAAQYFFNREGKKLRPMIVLLLSRSLTAHCSPQTSVNNASGTVMDGSHTPAQRQLAEITEMIHTASLAHDDVIDMANVRRGVRSLNAEHSNKIAILAGDFLLARASVSLARLRNPYVCEVMSYILENLAVGEILQMGVADTVEKYMRKTFCKTASLLAHSCQSAAMLSNHSDDLCMKAFGFGKHVGIMYQLVDDILDFVGDAETMGKAANGADLRSGLASLPVLIAAEREHPELRELIDRRFTHDGDVERALECVYSSSALEYTRSLIDKHCAHAIVSLMALSPSPSRDALMQLVWGLRSRMA